MGATPVPCVAVSPATALAITTAGGALRPRVPTSAPDRRRGLRGRARPRSRLRAARRGRPARAEGPGRSRRRIQPRSSCFRCPDARGPAAHRSPDRRRRAHASRTSDRPERLAWGARRPARKRHRTVLRAACATQRPCLVTVEPPRASKADRAVADRLRCPRTPAVRAAARPAREHLASCPPGAAGATPSSAESATEVATGRVGTDRSRRRSPTPSLAPAAPLRRGLFLVLPARATGLQAAQQPGGQDFSGGLSARSWAARRALADSLRRRSDGT